MKNNVKIWIAEDDRSLRWVMEKAITRDGMDVRSFESGDDLLAALRVSQPEIIISDIRMPGTDGLELLKQIHRSHPDIPVIITTAHSDLDSAVAAYQGGAFEYLPKPFDLDDIKDELLHLNSYLKSKSIDSPIPNMFKYRIGTIKPSTRINYETREEYKEYEFFVRIYPKKVKELRAKVDAIRNSTI